MRLALLLVALLPLAAQAAIPASLPVCSAGDTRTPVKSWEPSLNGRTLSSAPAAEDGDVFHIQFFAENDAASCAAAKADQLYSFDVPDADGGGLAVNLRGNVQFANGMCYFSGFFMNEAVMGMHQGWVETYFRPLDKVDVITSGRFCAASSVGRKPGAAATGSTPKAVPDGQMTSGLLREACGELGPGRPTIPAVLCGSYVRGFIEGALLQSVATETPQMICFPQGATILDAGQAYVRWYDRKRPSPGQLGSVSLGAALVEAYPCSRSP